MVNHVILGIASELKCEAISQQILATLSSEGGDVETLLRRAVAAIAAELAKQTCDASK